MLGGSPFDGRSKSAAEVSPVFSSCYNARSRKKVPTPRPGKGRQAGYPATAPFAPPERPLYWVWIVADKRQGGRCDIRPSTGRFNRKSAPRYRRGGGAGRAGVCRARV